MNYNKESIVRSYIQKSNCQIASDV